MSTKGSECRLRMLSLVRDADVMDEGVGWGRALERCEAGLRTALTSSPLRLLRDTPLSPDHERAARATRRAEYREVAHLSELLRFAFDRGDETEIARLLARGALLPMSAATRFELAVLIRLGEETLAALTARDGEGWSSERSAVLPAREDIFALRHASGAAVRFFYNQSVLDGGAADAAARHYFGSRGRLRPDVTVLFEEHGSRTNALVVECKHSQEMGVLVGGYHEALLYRAEYESALGGDIKAFLISSGGVYGAARSDDEVVATDWKRWFDERMRDALFPGPISLERNRTPRGP